MVEESTQTLKSNKNNHTTNKKSQNFQKQYL